MTILDWEEQHILTFEMLGPAVLAFLLNKWLKKTITYQISWLNVNKLTYGLIN